MNLEKMGRMKKIERKQKKMLIMTKGTYKNYL